MSKHDKLKLEKAARNEIYSLKFKRKDRAQRRYERKLRVKAREARLEALYARLEANRRDWPIGHPNA